MIELTHYTEKVVEPLRIREKPEYLKNKEELENIESPNNLIL